MTADSTKRPFKPSWIDRFNSWVKNQSMNAWVFYTVFGFVLIAIQILFLWLEGGLQDTEILPVIIYNGFVSPYLLALIYLLDNQAVTALNSLKSVLDTTESEFDVYEYQLSNMPSYPPLAAGLVLVISVMIMEQLTTVPVRYAALEGLPVFAVVFHIIDKSSAFLFGVFFYHTIRQLRVVNAIHSNNILVNLFNLGPLQAFSRLTASTAVGLVIGIYGWMLINPELLTDPVILGITMIITILAVTVFVWPLYAVHRRMEIAKEKALHEIDLRFEAVFAKFNQQFREDDSADIELLNATISSLDIQHRKVSAIPTWPWRPETARFALTSIALPLILAILQYFAKQVFG